MTEALTDTLGFTGLGQRGGLFPLDAAAEYLRLRPGRVLPGYVLAVAPLSGVMLYLIDTVTSGHRSALPAGAAMLVAATLWRWGALAGVQRRVQEDLRGQPPLPVRRRLGAILVARLASNALLTWGGLLIVPSFYGLFLSGVLTPALLENEGPAPRVLAEAAGLVHGEARRLLGLSVALLFTALLVVLSALVVQALLVNTVLSSLLGLETTDLELTLGSGAWLLCLGYFLFLVLDLYWTVASVMLFYDLQSRRLGTDLRLRLKRMAAAAAVEATVVRLRQGSATATEPAAVGAAREGATP